MYHNELTFSTFLFELSKIIRLVRGNHTVRGNTNVVRAIGTKSSSPTQSDVKKMVYNAYAWQIGWKGYDFFTKNKVV